MTKRSDIVRYTAEDIAAMLARGEDKTDWPRVLAKTENDIAEDMAGDPAWNSIDETWVREAEIVTDLLARPRENKRQVTMRFDADVVDYFKAGGRGWQGRMNAVLRRFMDRQVS